MVDPAEEFHRHAQECQRMARASADAESKATWRRMAERWQRCAEQAEQAAAAAEAAAAARTRKYRNRTWSERHAEH